MNYIEDPEDLKTDRRRPGTPKTRWDRICKRSDNKVKIRSTAVKQFLDNNYVSQRQNRMLNGDISEFDKINPQTLICMRHETLVKRRHILKDNTEYYDPFKSMQLDKIQRHNKRVEQKYLENELKKFKETINRKIPAIKITSENLSVDEYDCYETELHDIDFIPPSEITGTFNEDDVFDHHDVTTLEISDNDSDILDELLKVTINDDILRSAVASLKPKIEEDQEHVAEIEYQNETNRIIDNTSNSNPSNNEYLHESIVIKQLEINEKSRNKEADEALPEDIVNSPIGSAQKEIISEIISEKPYFNSPELRKILLQKYLLRWIHYNTLEQVKRKTNTSTKPDRIHQIQMFLNNIRMEKKKCVNKNKDNRSECATTTEKLLEARKVQNKIKIQQDIIEYQKAKLQRQEQLISELKLNKIVKDTRSSQEELKKEIKQLLKMPNVKTRLKVKCLGMMANVKEPENDRMQANGYMMPKFLIDMQERAFERNRRHQEAKERRERLEQEREDQRLALEEQKRMEDEDMKRRRIDMLLEKRRLEKQEKIRKEKERQHQLENIRLSKNFYRKYLLQYYGMRRFLRLVALRRENAEKAKIFRITKLKRTALVRWRKVVHQIWKEKHIRAIMRYRNSLKKKMFWEWYKVYLNARNNYFVAIDWYEMRISEKIIKYWHRHIMSCKLVEEMKSVQANSHYEWQLKWKVIEHWQRLKAVLQLEQETNERRQRWRVKIWELIPDYSPNLDKVEFPS